MNKRALIGIVLVTGLALVMASMAVAQEPTPAGLVLWNKLGSQAEIEDSEVGLDGTFNGGSFVEGRFGTAYMANYAQDKLVHFPKEVIPIDAGTIEFWAKLTGFPSNVSAGGWGHKPYFITIWDGYSAFQIGFEANDGAGNGGLCGNVGHGFHFGTGVYCWNCWTYAGILGTGLEEEWHHYALVWNKNGIQGVADGTKRGAVFLDGQLNSSRWHDYYGSNSEFVPLTSGELALIDNWGSQGNVAIDNIRIWNYAKTDFSDRFYEAPTITVPIDIKPGSDPNSISLCSHGVVPVAILSEDGFDATTVDPQSVEFAGATIGLRGKGVLQYSLEDVDGDGDIDFVAHIPIENLDLDAGSTEATVNGSADGVLFEGSDWVNIVRDCE